jgi:hypothetical protein
VTGAGIGVDFRVFARLPEYRDVVLTGLDRRQLVGRAMKNADRFAGDVLAPAIAVVANRIKREVCGKSGTAFGRVLALEALMAECRATCPPEEKPITAMRLASMRGCFASRSSER